MPLCTIFTKCPAPAGPQCRYPCSAGRGSPSSSCVRGAAVDAGRERPEDRIEPRNRLVLAADHEAVATLETEHAAGGPDIHEVQFAFCEVGGTHDVVAVVAVAAVDDDITR